MSLAQVRFCLTVKRKFKVFEKKNEFFFVFRMGTFLSDSFVISQSLRTKNIQFCFFQIGDAESEDGERDREKERRKRKRFKIKEGE